MGNGKTKREKARKKRKRAKIRRAALAEIGAKLAELVAGEEK